LQRITIHATRVINRHSTLLPFLHPLQFEIVQVLLALDLLIKTLFEFSRLEQHVFWSCCLKVTGSHSLVYADRGYNSNLADKSMLSTPNTMDSMGLQNFKSRSRLCLETLNGRLKKCECLNQTFRHGREKQSLAFKAPTQFPQLFSDMFSFSS
jgi:hypothetical protein